MIRFRREAAFDGAINFFVLWLFWNRVDDLQVMRNLCASLKPGIRAVVHGRKEFRQGIITKDWHVLDGGRFWLESREVLPGWESRAMGFRGWRELRLC
jgi:hypothetical protein